MKKLIISTVICISNWCFSQSWVQVGTTQTDIYMTTESKEMAVDSNGNIYIIGFNPTVSFSPILKKFNGSSWSNIDMTNFIGKTNSLDKYKLAIDNQNNVYVIYQGITGVATSYIGVQKWNGSDWSKLPTTAFYDDVSYGSLPEVAFDNNNILHVAIKRKNLQSNASWDVKLMKFENNVWSDIGTTLYESIGGVGNTSVKLSLEFDSNNIPYLCFQAPEILNYTAVYKFSGGFWSKIIGSDVIDYSNNQSFLINKSNNDIYVGVQPDFNNKYSVYRKFDGTSWTTLPTGFFNHDKGVSAINSSGEIFAVHTGLNSTQTDKSIMHKFSGGVWYKTDNSGLQDEINSTSYNVFRMSILLINGIPHIVYSTNGTLTGSGGRTKIYKYVGGYTLDTENISKKVKTEIYPNPFNENLNISTEENGIVSFYDTSGKLISAEKLSKGKNNINKSSLQKGVYLYQIKNNKNEIITSGKLIKK